MKKLKMHLKYANYYNNKCPCFHFNQTCIEIIGIHCSLDSPQFGQNFFLSLFIVSHSSSSESVPMQYHMPGGTFGSSPSLPDMLPRFTRLHTHNIHINAKYTQWKIQKIAEKIKAKTLPV